MKISLFLFIHFLHEVTCLENGLELKEYLNGRAEIVREKLIRRARNQGDFYDVKFNNIKNKKFLGNYSDGEVVTFFETPYVLLGQDLYRISQNASIFHAFLPNQSATFLQAAQYKTMAFVTFVTNSRILHVIGSNGQGFFKIQNIVHSSISRASFFESQNGLYLLVGTDTGALIYKFLESHFDEVGKIQTTARLFSFDHNGSQIIVALRTSGTVSDLYEFKNDTIKKILKFQTTHPEHALSYLYRGKRYVVIFSEKTVGLYRWTGDDLLLLEQLTTSTLTGRKKIFFINNHPYLFATNDNKILIFKPAPNQLNLIHKFEVSTTKTIWDYEFIPYENHTSTIAILGPDLHDGSATISVNSISIDDKNIRDKIINDRKMGQCFDNLEKNVYGFRNQLKTALNETELLGQGLEQAPIRQLNNLRNKLAGIKLLIENHNSSSLIINSSVVAFPLKASKVIARNIIFEKINHKTWSPNRWLSYSKPQHVSGLVKAQFVNVTNLSSPDNSLFNDVLLSEGDQVISGSISVKNLNARNIETKSLNDIATKDMCYKSKPTEPIEGLKRFPSIQADSIRTGSINMMDAETFTPIVRNRSVYKLDSKLKVDNLWVDNINQIDFNEFKNSVFRKGITETIRGNLTFADIKANSLTFDTVSREASFLTTSTDQTINSSITISKIFARDVESGRINGIDFRNSVATIGENVISGPVSIRHLNVNNNLELQGKEDEEFVLLNDTHIVGTNESDFLQIYNGKVKIRGDLFVKHVQMGKIFVNGSEFRAKFDDFWSRRRPQKIPTHFEAKNGVSTPHLFTTFINNVGVSDYMINSTQQRKSAKFYFDNVTVKGNVFLNPDEQHSPDLQQIEKSAVKLNGTFHIKGVKTYTGLLTVDKIEIAQTNGSSSHKIGHLLVKGDLLADNIAVKYVNDVELQQLMENSLFVDKPQNVSKINFENVTVDKLFVNNLNNQSMQQVISSVNEIDKIDQIENCFVDGHVILGNVENLTTINGHGVEELVEKSKSKYNDGTVFGNVKFSGKIKIKNFGAIVINNVDFEKESKRYLYKAWNQTLLHHITFNNLKTENLITDRINDFDIRNLIDVSSNKSQIIYAPHGLKLTENTSVSNLFVGLDYDLKECLANLKMPPAQIWNDLTVAGNVTFWDQESVVSDILQNVVTAKHSHVITSKITFSDHISAKNITASKAINNIDLKEIIDDAVLNKPGLKRVVSGRKSFNSLQAEFVRSLQNTDVSKMNDIAVRELGDKIVRKNANVTPITGSKVFFGGLQAITIQADVISGVKTADLVSYQSTKAVPNAVFESVNIVNNVDIKFVNNMPFDVIFKERLLKQSPKQTLTGNYYFENVKISENIRTPRINNVPVANVVYDTDVQEIESPKRFLEDVRVVGDVNIDFFNGVELSKAYEQAVLRTEETNFAGSVIFLNPTSVDGNIQTDYINSIPVDHLFDIADARQSMQSQEDNVNEVKNKIANFVTKYINATLRMPSEIMYLEESSEVQVSVPSAINARIVEIKNDILIHVESEESGSRCGLPNNCTCPLQQTLQISNSVTPITNKGNQRVYSYYIDGIYMQLVTTSVSTDSFCRTSTLKAMNEVSHLTWNTAANSNSTGGFFMHETHFTGYISGVEFFTSYGRTYIVIGKYYDPVVDTHAVDCTVLRLKNDKSEVEEIQRIPTQGLKTMSLLYTAQGVVLITSSLLNGTNTKIFRFDNNKQQFDVLREVPSFGSVFADGVVLETDSLIILANERSTLYILKYVKEFDNYYFYQNLQLDYPVSSLSVFYAEGFGISDAYLCVVTKNGRYFIYSFQFIQGWKVESAGQVDGLKALIPFKLNMKSYLLAPSSRTSSLLTIVEDDQS